MGLMKVSLFIIFVLVSYKNIKSWFDIKLPTVVEGYCHPLFQKVADVFRYIYLNLYQYHSKFEKKKKKNLSSSFICTIYNVVNRSRK